MPLRERQEVEEMSWAAGVDFSRARHTLQCNELPPTSGQDPMLSYVFEL
jgi:hypothetical protein